MPENQSPDPAADSALGLALENFSLSHPDIESIEISTVRGTRLRFPEANQAAPSFVPVSGGIFTKAYCSPEDLIPILEGRGLLIPDPDHALSWLRKVGYYRLSGYGLQLRERTAEGKLTDNYRPGTRFSDLIDLYEFDRHLRLHMLDAVERIEVAFRSHFNDVLAARYGPHWFMDPARFKVKTDRKSGRLIFDHNEFLAKTHEEACRSKESLPIGHYLKKYGEPPLPPCWMLGEVLSMGTWSKAYGMLSDRADQKAIASAFRSSPPELTSWIHALTNLRNTCAHHSRLWDRRFVTCPSKKGNLKEVIDTNDRLFAQIATALYCLWTIEPKSLWLDGLKALLQRHPAVPLVPMGFPDDWGSRLTRIKSQG